MTTIQTETTTQAIDNRAKESEVLLAHAANIIKPPLNEYLGSFVLHVYQQGSKIDTRTFNFATQFVGDVPEYLAVEAAKELKERMLARYGHKLKKMQK